MVYLFSPGKFWGWEAYRISCTIYVLLEIAVLQSDIPYSILFLPHFLHTAFQSELIIAAGANQDCIIYCVQIPSDHTAIAVTFASGLGYMSLAVSNFRDIGKNSEVNYLIVNSFVASTKSCLK